LSVLKHLAGGPRVWSVMKARPIARSTSNEI
jgi:hypothetical protein